MMQARVATLVCLGLVVLVGVTGVAVGSSSAVGSSPPVGAQVGPAPGAAVQESVDPDVVVMRATVREDGTASWSVAYRTRLDDENDTAAFESLQADIEQNSSAYTGRFETGMGRTVGSAENATGREMRLENLTVETTTEQFGQEYGVITYRFTWTNFATVDDGRLLVGDALSGLFLDSETSLVLAWPDGYETDSVRPEPDETRDNEVVWHGQLDFGPDQPRLALEPAGGLDAVVLAVAALALLALVAVGAGGVWRARGGGPFGTPGAEAGARSAAGGGAGSDEADGTADGEVAGDDEESDDREPPEELLSNEERVLNLLDEEGGRIKQQRIAEEFDWTDAKTSQVVGTLRDEDAVETFRIGRENVVTLPEESDL